MKKPIRILALLLAAVMLLGLFPSFALAATSEEPTETYCPSGRNDHNHFFNEVSRTEPKCKQDGDILYRCIYCGYEKHERINQLGHDWGNWKTTTQPTCTEEGVQTKTCRRCGHKNTRAVDALGHDWGPWETVKQPTCLEAGESRRSCNRCGLTESMPIDALGHDWGEWYVKTPPALDKEGIEERECRRCGLIEQRPIPPLAAYEDYALYLVLDPYDKTLYKGYFGDEYSEGDPAWVFVDGHVINVGQKGVWLEEYLNGPYKDVEKVFTSVWLEPGETADVNFLLVCENKLIDTSTASGNKIGTVHGDYCYYGWDNGERVVASNLVYAEWDVIDDEGPTVWDDGSELSIVKSVVGDSADPNGYQLDEYISFRIEVTNTGDVTVENISLDDELLTNGDPDYTIAELKPGETWELNYLYKVTLEDVQAHKVENAAVVSWGDPAFGTPKKEESNVVVVPTINKADVLLMKYVVSTPANDSYYVPGEEVVFAIYVKNNAPTHVFHFTIYDTPILDGTPVTTIEDLGPGEDGTYEVHYTVTEDDAYLGYFVNIAWGIGEDEFGTPVYFVSNEVEIPVDDDPYEIYWDLALVKEVISTPKNGEYYEEGETIRYKITATNAGFGTLMGYVFDPLKAEDFGMIGMFVNLQPDESCEFFFDYVVTHDDVVMGNVSNYAYCYWTPDEGEDANYYESESNEVWSKTGEGTPGLIPPVVWRNSDGKDYCVRTLLIEGDMAASYSLHLCGEHDGLADELTKLITEAENTSEAALLEAWKTARTKWAEALEKEYEAAYAAASGEAKAAVTKEKKAFESFVENYEKLLKGVGLDEQTIEKTVAELLMNRCADLCYDLHQAGMPRPDSIFAAHEHTDESMDYPKCMSIVIEINESDANYAEILCTEHRGTTLLVGKLLASAQSPTATANAWRKAQRLWQIELDRMVNTRYKAANGDTKKLIAAARVSFDKLVAARETYLNCLYSKDVAAELIAHLFEEKVIAVCNLVK